jgi:hypothetical protein
MALWFGITVTVLAQPPEGSTTVTAVDITKGITGIITTAMTVIAVLFVNFLARRGNSAVFGVVIPTRLVHFLLGPVLVVLNGALLLFLCALYQTADNTDVAGVQQQNKYVILGFLANPFYVGRSQTLARSDMPF